MHLLDLMVMSSSMIWHDNKSNRTQSKEKEARNWTSKPKVTWSVSLIYLLVTYKCFSSILNHHFSQSRNILFSRFDKIPWFGSLEPTVWHPAFVIVRLFSLSQCSRDVTHQDKWVLCKKPHMEMSVDMDIWYTNMIMQSDGEHKCKY